MLARFAKRAMSYEAKIAELGYKMPAPSKPVASYVMATRVGNLIYTGASLARANWLIRNRRARALTPSPPHAHSFSLLRTRATQPATCP